MNLNKITNRQAYADVLMEKAKTDKDVIVLCVDSRGSASMAPFALVYPNQFIELGIAEQNLVTVSAGLASCGKKAFAVSPAAFISTRSFEQAKVDVAYSETNVTLLGVSGGISYGALGMTHHACQDIAAMAALPGMRVYLPSDRFQTAALAKELLQDELPSYVRLSRTPSVDIYDDKIKFKLNKANVIATGSDVAIIACGEMVSAALGAVKFLKAKGISAGLIDMHCLKPIDKDAIIKAAKQAKFVVTVEEHSPFGGLGSMVAQIVSSECPKKVVNLSLPDGPIIAGSALEAFAHYDLTSEGIAKMIEKINKTL